MITINDIAENAENIELILIGENSEVEFREPVIVKQFSSIEEIVTNKKSHYWGDAIEFISPNYSSVVKTKANLIFKNINLGSGILSLALGRYDNSFFLSIGDRQHEIGHIIEYSPVHSGFNEFEIEFQMVARQMHVFPPHPLKQTVVVKDFGDIEANIDGANVETFLSELLPAYDLLDEKLFLETYETDVDDWEDRSISLKVTRWETIKEANARLVLEHKTKISKEEKRKAELEQQEQAEYERLKAKFEGI